MSDKYALDNVISFVDSAREAGDLVALESEFTRQINALGIERFTFTTHTINPDHTESVAYSVKDAWSEGWDTHYWQENYAKIDQIAKSAVKNRLPYDFSVLEAHKNAPWNQLYQDALDYGLLNGLSVPVLTSPFEMGMLVVHHANHDFSPKIKHALHLLTIHYQALLLPFLPKSIDKEITLTPREKQCLEMTRDHKAAGEIARALNISTRTVHFHIGNILRQFKVQNKYQAVMVAISFGLL